MLPHQISFRWPITRVHVSFEIFSKHTNVGALICHNIKTLTQPHFPRNADMFRTGTIFLPALYEGLRQMRKDLVLCALTVSFP